MGKEILLYQGLYNWTAEELIKVLNEHMGKPVTMRVNSPGGQVLSSLGLYAKMREHGNVTVKVDGIAASGAWNLLLYANSVECLQVSRFMVHRADGDSSTEENKKLLADINVDLRKQMESRISNVKFKEVSGYELTELFNPEQRINVWLNPKQMKDLGIVSKINKLEPSEISAIAAQSMGLDIAAFNEVTSEIPVIETIEKPVKITSMDINKFKSEHPAVYAEVVALGHVAGAKAEKLRIESWDAFRGVDAVAVQKGIEEGTEMTISQMAKFNAQAIGKYKVDEIQKDANGNVIVPAGSPAGAVAKTDAEVKLAAFEAEVDKTIGLVK